MNVCCPEDAVELIPALAPADGAGLRSIQGTATSFPELEELEEADVSVDGVVLVDGVALVAELELPADELDEITAKSTLPDEGFKMMSLIVPMV